MTAKITTLNLNYIIQEYRTGRTAKDIARELSVGTNTILRRLSEAQEPMRPNAAKVRIHLPEPEVVEMFNSGIGVRGIADRFECAPSVVHRALKANGLSQRNRSEQQAARMARSSPEERQSLAAAAHEAARGRKRSLEEKTKSAKTRQERETHTSKLERRFAAMLIQRGLTVTPQHAIGPYNCDFARHPVAVEIFGGGWHWHGHHLAMTEDRFRYILNAGWHILVFAIDGRRWPLNPQVADYAVTEINRLSSLPPAPCQYRVIWGAGEFTTEGSANDDKLSIEPPFTNTRDALTGRYKRIPR